MARRLSIGRLRGGELLAGVGAVVLLVSLFLDWFAVRMPAAPAQVHRSGVDEIGVSLPGSRGYSASGWDTLGWLVLAIVAAAIVLAVWLVVATAIPRPVTEVIAAAVLATTVGTVAFVMLALRAFVFQPGANAVTELRYGGWIGLAGALALAVGAWWSLADERTDAPESAYVPPAPRPAPPPASS
jgi:hypothetical protein